MPSSVTHSSPAKRRILSQVSGSKWRRKSACCRKRNKPRSKRVVKPSASRSKARPRLHPWPRKLELTLRELEKPDEDELDWLPGLELHPHSRLQRALSYD